MYDNETKWICKKCSPIDSVSDSERMDFLAITDNDYERKCYLGFPTPEQEKSTLDIGCTA